MNLAREFVPGCVLFYHLFNNVIQSASAPALTRSFAYRVHYVVVREPPGYIPGVLLAYPLRQRNMAHSSMHLYL